MFLIAAAMSQVYGCAGTAEYSSTYDPLLQKAALNQASADFKCSQDQLSLTHMAATVYKADGCGNEGYYSVQCDKGLDPATFKDDATVKKHCKAIRREGPAATPSGFRPRR